MEEKIQTNFSIGTEPYAKLTYGDLEIKIGLTLIHSLEGLVMTPPILEANYWRFLQNFSQTLKGIEKSMWKTLDRQREEMKRIR